MGSLTPHLRLAVPDFDQDPWDVDVNGNWAVLDATVGMFSTIPNLTGVWKNSFTYTFGQSVVDPVDSSVWSCVQTHTSPAPPTSFANDRIAFPARWAQTANGAQFYASQAANSAAAAATSAANAAASAAKVGNALSITGGTMTGPLILSGDPASGQPLGAATKQYVDARVGGTGFLPLTGGVLTGQLTIGGTGANYSAIPTPADRHPIAFGWNGQLYFHVDGAFVGNLALQSFVADNYVKTSGGTITGTLTVLGESQAQNTFRITSSNFFINSIASATNIQFDGGGWTLQYVRADGTLRYLRGGDFAVLFSVDGGGNGIFSGSANVGFDLVAARDVFARGGSIFFGAGDRAHLFSDNGTVSALYMLDNYRLEFHWADASLNWIRGSDTGTLLKLTNAGTLSVAGSMTTGTDVLAFNTLFAVNSSMVIGSGGSGRIMQFAPNWYWDWNVANGTLAYVRPDGNFIVMDLTDNIIFNNKGPMAGHGAYIDLSDARIKSNIEPSLSGLHEIMQLSPIRFTRNIRGDDAPVEEGFSAQDVQHVLPSAVVQAGVFTDKDEEGPLLGVTLSPIVAALVNGMKELATRMTALENR
jgi:hypothetical protein